MRFFRHPACAGAALFALLGMPGPASESRAAQAGAPETLTLEQAIARAEANEPAFAAAAAAQKAAELERTNARVALLPTVSYHNQVIYTEPNGVPTSRIGQTTNAPAPLFIANNAVREYASQGLVDERLGLRQVGEIRLADANAARARAQFEVARRGLVATVASLYYGIEAATGKTQTAQDALDEANRFLDTTEKREREREAAHVDVLKAQLAQQQRQRAVLDAQTAEERARVELAVLLFSDPETPVQLAPEEPFPPLPDRGKLRALAAQGNPELGSAQATVQAGQAEVSVARAALLPELGLNFTYGIDATNVGVNGPDGIHNLGYSIGAQLDFPVWDWLATGRRIKEATLRESAAKVAMSATQRRVTADLAEDLAEASTAQVELGSLGADVGIARENLRLTNLRYTDGESTALEVLDAEGALISAEDAEIDGRTRYRFAWRNLQTLMGRL